MWIAAYIYICIYIISIIYRNSPSIGGWRSFQHISIPFWWFPYLVKLIEIIILCDLIWRYVYHSWNSRACPMPHYSACTFHRPYLWNFILCSVTFLARCFILSGTIRALLLSIFLLRNSPNGHNNIFAHTYINILIWIKKYNIHIFVNDISYC